MERERYKMLYGIEDHLDPKQYDFVLDTTSLTEQEVFDKVMWLVKARLA
jgi:cytidylate kinase